MEIPEDKILISVNPSIYVSPDEFVKILKQFHWHEHLENIDELLSVDTTGKLRFLKGVLQQEYIIYATFKCPVCFEGMGLWENEGFGVLVV